MSAPTPAPNPLLREVPNILFVAVGAAGIRLISHLPRRVPELRYAAVDTDKQALDACPFEQKLLLGQDKTGGLGTGSNPDLARSCAEAMDEDWLELIGDAAVVILVAGLGGGTGGGCGPYLAERARDLGKIVLAAVVRPLEAEGGHRRHAADAALSRYREHCQAVSLFPLDSLVEDHSMTLQRLISRCGLEVARAIGGLAVLLRTGWLVPLTLMDMVEVMKRADGYCRLAAVSADGEERLPSVLEQLFAHPLLDKGSLLAHSGGVVLGILCGPQTTIGELESISRDVRGVLRSDAELKIGIAQDERFGRYLGLVVMVAERWSARAVPLELVTEADRGTEKEESEEARREAARLVQSEIDLAVDSKGRFKDAEPTIVEGADLDTPTFIRKGIRLSTRSNRR